MPGPSSSGPMALETNGKAHLDGDVADEARLEQQLAADRDYVIEVQRIEIETLAAKVAITAGRWERKILEIEAREADRRRDLEIAVEAARREITELRSSTSWRATAGVRYLSARARRFVKR